MRVDHNGEAFETAWDIVSLGSSVIDVISNPTDIFAWAGLAGDVVDELLPGIGGIGEATKATGKLIRNADKIKDAGKAASNAPVVIGQTMKRVREFAQKCGGEFFTIPEWLPFSEKLTQNARWIQEMMDEGRTIIDIGPDPQASKISPFYTLEKMLTSGYRKLVELFQK